MTLDSTDIRMALAATHYYRRAFVLLKRPVPPAADRLVDHLQQALVAANGQETAAAQPHWYSTRQVAQLLGISDRTARRLAKQIGQRVGRAWIIPADALPSEDE
jgi:hypothetical protein